MDFLTEVPDAKLYYVMAKELVPDRNLWDDCVQEAAIYVWQMRQQTSDKPQAWYNTCARYKIQEVGKRQRFFGQPEETCSKFMPRKKENCARVLNHPGSCLTRKAMGKKTDRHKSSVAVDPLRRPHDSYEQLFTGWGNE